MELSDLKVFEAVSRHGSMNRAAQELNTVQSNVTARIQALEEELGVTLFRRHARGVTTTLAGERMLPYVAKLTKLLADARSAATDDGTPSGPLQLGSLETTVAIRLSPLLERFVRAHPAVQLALRTGTTAELIGQVTEGRLDGAFVAGPISHPDLHTETIFKEELVLVTAPSVRSPAELSRTAAVRTVVFRLGCSYRQRLEAVLSGIGVPAAKPQEFGSLDAIVSCVSAGFGVTLLPRSVVAQASCDGRVALHALPPDQAEVETLFIRRHDAYVSSAMRAFLALASDAYGAAAPSPEQPARLAVKRRA